MDNTIYVALSRQMALRNELNVIANNVANVDTPGFKLEQMLYKTEPGATAKSADGPSKVNFVLDDKVARDFGQGALRQTGSPFDLAIEGTGFFRVSTSGGERYTRDGRFTLAPDGKLSAQDGAPVLDPSGREIVIDPSKGQVAIGKDGTVTQGTEQVGKIGIVRFESLASLEKTGENRLKNVLNQTPRPATDATVHQGYLEASNVNSVLEITRLIEVSRSYELLSKILEQTTDLDRRSIERLGRVA